LDLQKPETTHAKKKTEITIHSSTAEYLIYFPVVWDDVDSMEMRYEDENI